MTHGLPATAVKKSAAPLPSSTAALLLTCPVMMR
jgi:hypothetical protein